MKWLVTGGHTGLGKTICDLKNGDAISRKDGYDIKEEADIIKIIEMSMNYDVFVNNAFDGPPDEPWANFGQTQVLLKMHKAWKDAGKEGYIFNIGSIGSVSVAGTEPEFEKYRVAKAALDYASLQCTKDFTDNIVKHRTTLIRPSRLDTEKVRSRASWTGNGIDCEDIVAFMDWCLNGQFNTCTTDVTIDLNTNFGN